MTVSIREHSCILAECSMEFIYLGSCSLERSRLEEMVRLAAELEVEDFILESKIHQDVKDMKIIVQKDDNYDGSCEVSEKWLSPEKQSDIPVIKFEETYATKRLCLIDPLDFPKGDKQINLKSISKLADSKQETEKNAKIDIVSEVYYVGNNEISNIKISFEEGQEDEKHKFDWFKCDKCDKMYTSQQTLYSHEKKQHGFATAKRKVFTIPKTELPEPDMSGLYNCDECDFSSEKKFRFRKHRAVIHEGFSYNCQTCPSSFKRRERLKKHIESVHEGVGFKCTECSKQFSNQRSLENHEDKKKKCKHCNYFSCWNKVDKHISTIHNTYFINGFNHCDQCSYQTTKSSRIKPHKDKTHDSTLKSCEHCDYKNKSKAAVKNHTEDKHFGMIFPCTSCDFTGTKIRLRNHRQNMHRLQDFPCTECSYVGKTSSKYQYHRVSKHTNEHYNCVKCNMKFNSRDSYTRHMKHQHESQPLFCDRCSYAAKSLHLLNFHIKKRHTGLLIYQCSKCNYQTNEKMSLRSHEQVTHEGINFECEKCGKPRKTLKSLVDHRRVCQTGIVAKKERKTPEFIEGTEGLCCDSQECCRTTA